MRKKRDTSHRSEKNGQTAAGALYPMLRGVTAGLFLMAALLLAFSFLLTKADVPFSLLGPITQLIAAASSLFAGWLAARALRRKGLLVGMGCGMIVFLVLLALSFCFDTPIDLQLVFKCACCVLGGGIGGVLGVNAKPHRRKAAA